MSINEVVSKVRKLAKARKPKKVVNRSEALLSVSNEVDVFGAACGRHGVSKKSADKVRSAATAALDSLVAEGKITTAQLDLMDKFFNIEGYSEFAEVLQLWRDSWSRKV